MANTRYYPNPETMHDTGDPDQDLAGTYPGSSPPPEAVVTASPDTVPTTSKSRPYRTIYQQRDYHEPVPILEPQLPLSEEDISVALSTLAGIRDALLQKVPKPDTKSLLSGTLVGPNGRVVLGSRALSPEAVKAYIANNPGAFVAE